MKNIRILLAFFACLVAIITQSMIKEETPSQMPFEKITPKFLALYSTMIEPSSTFISQEKQKFKKINLTDSKDLLAHLRNSLDYKHPLVYLRNLQIIASFLLLQDLWFQMESAEDFLYMFESYLYDESKKLTEQIDPLSFESMRKGIYLIQRNLSPELANIVLVYPELIKPELFDQHTQDILYKLIFSRDSKIRDFGSFLRVSQSQKIIRPEYKKTAAPTVDFLALLRNNRNLAVELPANELDFFLFFSNELMKNYNEFAEKNIALKSRSKGKEFSITEILKDLHKKKRTLAASYFGVRDSYQKLYEIIRKEMSDVIKDQIEKDKTLVRTLLSFHEVPMKGDLLSLPKTLPASFLPFKNPPEYIKLPTFDDELEKAYEKWKKDGSPEIAKPIIIRKMRRKPKKKPSELVLPEEESVEEKSEESQKSSEPAVIKQADDGSYMLEGDETDQRITIYNPDHNTTEIVFKTANPNAVKEKLTPDYTDWVKQWFKDPQQAIKDQGYTDPKSKKLTEPRMYWKPIALHAFSQLVDSFIQKWGKKTEVANRRNPGQMDTLITLPGMMIYADGTQETGVFAYLIDSRTGKWYHRMFEPQGTQKLVQDLLEKGFFNPGMTGYYDVAFPALKRP